MIRLKTREKFFWIDLSDRHLGNETISSEQKEYQRIRLEYLEYEKPFHISRTDSIEVKTFPKHIYFSFLKIQ